MNIRLPRTQRLPEMPEAPAFLRQEEVIEKQMADIAQHVMAARDLGDRSLLDARLPAKTLPPTASNIFAHNALQLLNKREELLNMVINLADNLDQLAGENVACGVRIQDCMKLLQDVTADVVRARTALALVPPQTASEPESATVTENEPVIQE